MSDWDALPQIVTQRGADFGLAFAFGLLALFHFGEVLEKYVNEPTPRARSMGVTNEMATRADLAVLTYAFFLFYGMIAALFRLPGRIVENLFIDGVVNLFFVLAISFLVLRNVWELVRRGTLSAGRALYQFRLLGDRGIRFSSLALAATAFLTKYQVQGWPALETLIDLLD